MGKMDYNYVCRREHENHGPASYHSARKPKTPFPGYTVLIYREIGKRLQYR
jgi:hypothetical protein